MKIPIQNIYYILCYAWDNLKERDLVNVRPIDTTDLVDLFAMVLISALNFLRKRGLDRGYIDYSEDLRLLRGKINLGETLKRNLLTQSKAHCEYDTLSYDVLHNQILKSTIRNLVKVKELDDDLKDQLYEINQWLAEIGYVPLTSSTFRNVRLNRNNSFYRLPLNICELIAENLLISQDDGDTVFRDLTQDENVMNRIFENFIRNFYKHEQDNFDVDKKFKRFSWQPEDENEKYRNFIPSMNTDIVLSNDSRVIIIDTKYYKGTLAANLYDDKKKIKSPNLYQIFSYLKNIEHFGGPASDCEGILLYPTVDDELDLPLVFGGHKIRIYTINLNQHWQGIHKDLINLIDFVPCTNFGFVHGTI